MGTDEIFKKRREVRRKRDFGYKQPRANSYLIETEGKRTEPLYFRGMKKNFHMVLRIRNMESYSGLSGNLIYRLRSFLLTYGKFTVRCAKHMSPQS